MKRSTPNSILAAALLCALQAAHAGDVNGLTTFTAGTPARAADVNTNFTAVKTAVDDNHARIGTLETNPSITGNLTLAPSTATAGNILKGAVPFLHDFGTNNTFLGENAGNFTMTGSENTAVGASVLLNNSSGYGNTAIGYVALTSNTAGSLNTAIGGGALNANTTGSWNTATGDQALLSNTIGFENTASGRQALSANTSGLRNTAIGVLALRANISGNYNTAVSAYALLDNTTGINNIALGYAAGSNLTTGSNNIAIGHVGVAGDSDTLRIGYPQTRAFIAGIRGVTTATPAVPVLVGTDGQLGTASSSRRVKDDIADMGDASSVLMRLRPVTFHYKSDRNPKGRALQYGLIAEEVAEVAPGLVARSAAGDIETVYYQHLAPMLLNEMQKQQRTIEAQAAALERQAQEIAEFKRRLARLEQPERIARTGRATYE